MPPGCIGTEEHPVKNQLLASRMHTWPFWQQRRMANHTSYLPQTSFSCRNALGPELQLLGVLAPQLQQLMLNAPAAGAMQKGQVEQAALMAVCLFPALKSVVVGVSCKLPGALLVGWCAGMGA